MSKNRTPRPKTAIAEIITIRIRYTTTDVDGGALIEPTLTMQSDMLQALVDHIHTTKKPSEGKFTEGKLEATEGHLSDLRQLLKLK